MFNHFISTSVLEIAIIVLKYLALYIALGCLWVLWFERFCYDKGITGLDGGVEWSQKERISHIIFWVVLSSYFLISIISFMFFEDHEDDNHNLGS